MASERRAGAFLSYVYIIVNTLTVLVYQKVILSWERMRWWSIC